MNKKLFKVKHNGTDEKYILADGFEDAIAIFVEWSKSKSYGGITE